MIEPTQHKTVPEAPSKKLKGGKYFIKTPWWMKKLYPQRLWKVATSNKVLYLTFDDGPHPQATPFVLSELKKYNALATFFCIGKNVVAWPEIYKEVISAGHTIGNHTQNHLNGWKVDSGVYLNDIAAAAAQIDANLFRPPYGRMTSFQAKHLRSAMPGRKPTIVMWDVLSGDFDLTISPQNCLENVIFRAEEGSIIVFHDSEKAFANMQYCLPKILNYFSEKGFRFDAIKAVNEESGVD